MAGVVDGRKVDIWDRRHQGERANENKTSHTCCRNILQVILTTESSQTMHAILPFVEGRQGGEDA